LRAIGCRQRSTVAKERCARERVVKWTLDDAIIRYGDDPPAKA
jgi:hypothetical protein